MKPLLVGEDNPYGSDPKYALYPHPERSAGWNLCVKVMGLPRAEYLRLFDRVNLCARKWSMKEARARAEEIKRERADVAAPVVLCGSKVCDAFGVEFLPFTATARAIPADGWFVEVYAVIPHPSGLSRLWNTPGSFECARRVLREAGVLPQAPVTTGTDAVGDAVDEPAAWDTGRDGKCSNCGLQKFNNVCLDCGVDAGAQSA